MELYRDIAVLGVQGCAAKGHDTARQPVTQPRACAQHDAQCAWLGAESQYKDLYRG